ncbi:MAG: HpaII family restriction endonuclease [Rickettsiales bacterium]|nr:HpaII family restriction endonuclease [Rickettsiales bacterium]
MGKKFNKGEWSEFYVFIKVLHDKKIYLLDSNLNKLDEFYKIAKILRKEDNQSIYHIKDDCIIKSFGDKNINIEVEKIKPYIGKILKSLKESQRSAFFIQDIDEIFDIINSDIIKVGSSYDKSDINLVIDDDANLSNKDIGFNVKSYIGNPPTLLNSSRATNFEYEVIGFNGEIERVNNINTKNKIRDRISYLLDNSNSIKFAGLDNNVFCRNLKLIDSLLPDIISIFLLNFFSGNGRKINEISTTFPQSSLNLSSKDFNYKIKAFLLSIALGLVPTKEWDGYDSANGYIVVKNDGDIGCFNVLEKKTLANYLFNNTKFDTPSSSRHDYGYVYKKEGKYYIKLNLQIRF